MSLIEIFKAGRHVAMSGEAIHFGETELEQVASSYDPALHEAPLVIGHPAHNDPAYGWVKGLSRTASGTLEARTDQVQAEFAEMVKEGRFKKISASFYRPDGDSNPVPGSWYLRHVGFLGAQPPAVKGLREVSLGEKEVAADFVSFAEVDAPALLSTLRKLLVEHMGEEEVAKAFTKAAEEEEEEDGDDNGGAGGESTPGSGGADMSEPDRRRAEELDRRERRLEERERQARRQRNADFLERIVGEGRPLPCPSSTLLSFLELLEERGDTAVSFGESEQRAPAQIFREDVLARLPKQVELGEVGGGAGNPGTESRGPEVIAREAVAYQEEQRAKGVLVTTTEAVAHVRQKGQ